MSHPRRRVSILVAMGALLWASLAIATPQGSVLEQAQSAAGAGQFPQAIELYRQVLQTQPGNTEALGGLADVLAAVGRWREAILPLTHLVEREPMNAPRLFQLGRLRSWQAGEHERSLELLKRAAELRPDDPEYQIEYAEVMSWRSERRPEALSILRAVLTREPMRADARRLLARILGWQGQREAALAILQPLLNQAKPDAEDFWVLGQVEESSGQMQPAANAYREALRRNADHLPSLARLAEILSWSEGTRAEAASLFEQGLQRDPHNEALLIPYAQMLSWNRATRGQAMKYFEEVLAEDPNNPRALAGKAQLLAWSGRSSEALQLYEQVLSADPSNLAALQGKAEILNWRGKHAEALALLNRARPQAADDSRTLLELARANYGLQRYAEARTDLAQVRGETGPEFEELKRNVNHALGTFTELGYDLRRNRNRLDYHRLEALVSTPLGFSNRLSLLYRPTLFQTSQEDFNSNYYALALDSQPAEDVTTHLEMTGEMYPGAPPQVGGALSLQYRVRPSFKLTTGFERRAVDETLLSTRGVVTSGLFLGQVRSNLGSIEASYSNSAHHYDLSLTYTDGVYTGRNLASNRRWSLDANLGKSVHSYQPYVRVAYGFSYLSFDHDADFQPGQAPPQLVGGYFSPTRYFLNSGMVYIQHDLGRRLKWEASTMLGVQNAETATSPLSQAQFASTFGTHLVWSFSEQNELRIGYEFLNVFNAFRRNLLLVKWRHYY